MKKRKESIEKSTNVAVREKCEAGQVKQVRTKTKKTRTAEGVHTPARVCTPSSTCAVSSKHGNRPNNDVSSARAKTPLGAVSGENCKRKKIKAQPSTLCRSPSGGAEQKLSSQFSSMSCLSPLTCGFLRSVHFEYATPVQEACLPLLSPRFQLPGVHTPQSHQHSSSSHLGRYSLFSSSQNFHFTLKHHDVAVEAPTGSGKTLAFVLPLIERMMKCLNLYEKGTYRRNSRDNADGKNSSYSCHFVWDLEKKNRQQRTTTHDTPQDAPKSFKCNNASSRGADNVECTYTSHAPSRGLSHADGASSPSEKQDISSQYSHFVSSITEDLSSNHVGENDGRTCRFGGIIIAPTRELARQIFTVVQQCIRSIESTLLPLPDDKMNSLQSSSAGEVGIKKKRKKRRRHHKACEGLPQPLSTLSNGRDDKEEEDDDDERDQDEKEDEEDSNEPHEKKPRNEQKEEDHPRTETGQPDVQRQQSSSCSSSSFPSPSSSSFVLKSMLLCGGGRPVEADRLSLWSRRSSSALFLLVATPGRLLRLIESEGEGEEGKIAGGDLLISSRQRKLPWSFLDLSLLVVDEADRLMDEQHSEDLKKLLTYIREEKKRAVCQLQLQRKMEMKDDSSRDHPSETKKEEEEKLSSDSNLSSWIGDRIQIAIFSATLAGTVEEQQRSKALWGILKDPICIRVSNSSASPVPSSSSSALMIDGGREQEEEKGQARGSEAHSQQLVSSSSSYQRHTVPSTLQNFYTICQYEEKLPFLLKFIQSVIIPRQAHCIVFFLTCHCVEFYFCLLSALLCNSSSYPRASSSSSKENDSCCFPLELEKLHGKMKQRARLAACRRFGSSQGKGSLLLATDVAARGLDFPNVDCILQLDPPQDPNVFIHRIGRTARAGRSGSSLLLLLPHEDAYVPFLTNRGVAMQEFSESEWVGTLENCQLEKGEEGEKHTTAAELCTGGANNKENGVFPPTQGGWWRVRPLVDTKKELEKEETEVLIVDEEEEGRLKVLRKSERDMVNTSALDEVLQDRNLVLKGTKAFVSFVRAYKEHLLSFLLPFSKVDLGRVATSMYLLRLPRMKEIVGKNFSNFKQHAIDPLTVPFRHDVAREEERLETLQASLEQRAKLREEREKKKKNEEKKRIEKQKSLYSKSTMKNPGRTKAEKRKARRQNALDEWEELAFEERMARKLRKRRITEEQYEKQLKQGHHGGGTSSRDEGGEFSDSEDEKGSLSCSSDSDEEGSTAVSSNGRGGMDVESDDGDSACCASAGESSTGLDDDDEIETGRPRKKVDGSVGDEGNHDRKKRKQPKWISVRGRKGKKKRRGKKRK